MPADQYLPDPTENRMEQEHEELICNLIFFYLNTRNRTWIPSIIRLEVHYFILDVSIEGDTLFHNLSIWIPLFKESLSWILKKQERTEWELRVLSVEQLRERVRYVCQSTILSGRNWASIIIRKERNPSRARTFRVSSWVSIDSLRLPNGRLYNLGSSRPCVCGEGTGIFSIWK